MWISEATLWFVGSWALVGWVYRTSIKTVESWDKEMSEATGIYKQASRDARDEAITKRGLWLSLCIGWPFLWFAGALVWHLLLK